ncbi:MAG: Protease 2 [Lentisphaerae bacterium ADurb.BinA184]|nr:MAG: Protease 2 [Lentisphaerae bacterium ADurb.BinA184]
MPLTLSEYAEWGDPAVAADWLSMRAYSPYENVRPAHLPALMVTANLNDSQVPFWEPVRWVARLRAANRGRNPVLLLTHRHADHDGPSGRSRRLRERAVEWAFLLSLLPDATRPEAPSHCAPCRARRGCGSASPGSPRP